MQAMALAQPGHVADVLAFASRAWRRPLTLGEQASLRAFYRTSRTTGKLSHEGAMRATAGARADVAGVPLSRRDRRRAGTESTLNDWEMASRMSFFLWSSIPDDELRRAAAAKELSDPKKLAAQVARMTADPKARRLSTEFFGQWLGFYHFDEYRGVDTGRFPEFTDAVRTAMYDESVSTFEYMVRERRPVKEILDADYTFLNQPLAKFYGLDEKLVPEDKREGPVRRSTACSKFDRGGALRLGAVLTTTSAPLRTSPVKRGDWILRRILVDADAAAAGRRRHAAGRRQELRGPDAAQRLTAHKRDAKCASCHLRIDPLGFPLEGFDAVGRTRTAYNDGKPVDTTGEFRDKTTIVGTAGLLGLPAEAGRQGADDAVAQDDRLRPRAHAAAVRSAADRRDGQGRRRRHLHRSGHARHHQPPVPQPRPRRRPAARARAVARPRIADVFRRREQPMSHRRPSLDNSRRHFLRGVGVALALPWLESMPWAGSSAGSGLPAGAARRAAKAGPPLRMGIVFFSNGVEPAHWWAKGSGATMELGPGAAADAAAPRGHGLHPRPVQPVGVRLDQPAPRAHEPALGRADQPRSERDPGRHLDGPGRRQRRSATRPRSRASSSASSPTSCGSRTGCR